VQPREIRKEGWRQRSRRAMREETDQVLAVADGRILEDQ